MKKIRNPFFSQFLILGMILLLINGCKKETIVQMPVLTSTSVSNITQTSATSGGTISSDGGGSITTRGVCWSAAQNPTIADSKTADGTGAGSFTSNISGLTANTAYNVRAYATNSAGTSYGNQVSLTTSKVLVVPTITTAAITAIASTSATGGGNITDDGGAAVSARGICWSANANPTITDSKTTDGTGTGSFTSSMTGLIAGKLYHVRAYATNNIGTSYGTDVTFSSLDVIPTLTTNAVSNITTSTATGGGNVTSGGLANIKEYGLVWSTSANPTTNDNQSMTTDVMLNSGFTLNMSFLQANTLYHVRSYAKNSAGTGYGNDVTFTTTGSAAITDAAGNVYHSVTIGTQVWLVENLKTTKYRNGDLIPICTDGTQSVGLTTGARCSYNNDAGNTPIYGLLYNFYAVNDSRGIAPTGYHIATNAEWTTLINFYGGPTVAGGKLKEAGITHWATPNTGATNDNGFSALPGGWLVSGGLTQSMYLYLGNVGVWWTSTSVDTKNAIAQSVAYNDVSTRQTNTVLWTDAFSVRCVKD